MKIVKKNKEIPLPCKIDARGEDWQKIESILLQSGFKWRGGDDPPTGFGPFFFLTEQKIITYMSDYNLVSFKEHESTETPVHDIFKYIL